VSANIHVFGNFNNAAEYILLPDSIFISLKQDFINNWIEKMNKIKWCILGTGWISRKFAEALKAVDNSELYAVGSRTRENAESFAREFNVTKAYSSYDEATNDRDVNVIYIGTPHTLHCENTLMCLEKGKNVLCEKPFGINGSEVRKMVAKAKEKNLFLMEALWTRFLPNIIKTKELIDSGEIGKVKFLNSCFSVKSSYGPEHRQYNRALGGGSLLDIGIYNVFLSLFLLGKPKEFIAMAGIGNTDVDNSCSFTFKYDNDTLAVMYSSFMAQSNSIAEIHGETGKILLPHMFHCPNDVIITKLDGEEKIIPFEFKSNGYNFEAEEVVKCLQAGKTQSELMSWNDSLELIDMLDSIRERCGIVYPGHDL
jgi:scyllo-inositol 2-dehydrogenase (NADP+)